MKTNFDEFRAISLFLGRKPTLSELPADGVPVFRKFITPQICDALMLLVDDTTEHDIWLPHHVEADNVPVLFVQDYPPTQSHAISCFQNSCRLAVIINDIIAGLYSSPHDIETKSVFKSIRHRLSEWRTNSPQHLRCEPFNLPEISPPPHIITQK